MEQQTGSKQEKESVKAVYCHPAYLTYAEYIIINAGLDEAQAGIKIAGRNINNLRYSDDTTLMAESEELKNLLMKAKEDSWLLRATVRSPLRSPAQVEGTQGFLPQPGKDLERPSSTRLEARLRYHGSGAMTRSPSPLAWRPDFPGAPREAH